MQVSRGTMTGIDWDDGCFNCDSSQCINQTCGVDESYCYEVDSNGNVINNGPTTCDLQVYVGWSGSDVNGNIFTSNSKRLSAFRSYSVAKVYDTASASVPSINPKIPCLNAQIQGCTPS